MLLAVALIWKTIQNEKYFVSKKSEMGVILGTN
jgi:hypothetical protein